MMKVASGSISHSRAVPGSRLERKNYFVSAEVPFAETFRLVVGSLRLRDGSLSQVTLFWNSGAV